MAKHLTVAEREFLHRLVKAKKSKAEIGALMSRHRSTIYRELARNSNRWGYRPKAAERWARQRREVCRRPHKLRDVDLRFICGGGIGEGLVARPDCGSLEA